MPLEGVSCASSVREGKCADSKMYGPNRNFLWEDLGAIRGLWEDPWCIGGDFNVMRFLGERTRLYHRGNERFL